MFNNDVRSKKILLVAHCLLNQNAKLDQLASRPGVLPKITQEIINSGAGIIQMPCPEMLGIGLDRHCIIDATLDDIKFEKTRVAKLMSKEKQLCINLAQHLVFQLKQYKEHNFEIIGVLGVNMSPTCGVETTWADNEEVKGNGIFIKTLKEEIEKAGINIDFTGITPIQIEDSVNRVKNFLNK
jgi:predicted secreted protein